MDILIKPTKLSGKVFAPPSKSQLHRLVICASLAEGKTTIELVPEGAPVPLISDDIQATINCLEALGAKITQEQNVLHVDPIAEPVESARFDCASSGSTLRFMLPLACALCPNTSFDGSRQLKRRPIADLVCALGESGVEFANEDGAAIRRKVNGPLGRGMATASLREISLPFSTHGLMQPGDAEIAGDLSSQFASGMLFGLAAISTHRGEGDRGDTLQLHLTSEIESHSYLKMTLQALRDFGLRIDEISDGWSIPCGQTMRSPGYVRCEGDWSNGAVFLALQKSNPDLEVMGLKDDSLQGDRCILHYLEKWQKSRETGESLAFDMGDTPDLFPLLACLASTPCEGGPRKTLFTDTYRLRYKESNRITSTDQLLSFFGTGVSQAKVSCIVMSAPYDPSHGTCEVYSAQDHRIVMAAVLAAHLHERPVLIESAECISKSFPEFFDLYRSLGGQAEILD